MLEQQVQTLSFVHKSLQEGTLPTDVEQHFEPASHPVADAGEIVGQAQVSAASEVPAEDQALPPIPPLTADPAETFVTTGAN